jgi:hypothetical protein
MNLRIADARALVDFIHRMVSTSGKRILAGGDYDVVDVDGVVFYHASGPVTVGGPFQSLEHLIPGDLIDQAGFPFVHATPDLRCPRGLHLWILLLQARDEALGQASSLLRRKEEGG